MARYDPTLLIVEDEFMIAAEIEASAEDAGYHAVVVPSLQLAHAALQNNAVVGAILDFRVTDGQTSALARCLKLLHVPYVVVSGSPKRELAMAGIEFERIFNKPADYGRVIKTLCNRFGMPAAA